MRLGLWACAAFGASLLGVLASTARAATEDFSTFSIYTQQEDDESTIDHLLLRPPRSWRDEWERASQALRTSEGCLTSGQWTIDTRLKMRTPLGGRSTFGLDVLDEESDQLTVEHFDFSFRFPSSAGTPGFYFRPYFDKSRQDLGLFWEAGADTSDVAARLTFTFEDTFNKLWAFRQTRVGQNSEPYEVHPYEPALWARVSRPSTRAEVSAQWLTPSRQRFQTFDGSPEHHTTLWGALATASLEQRVSRLTLEADATNRQALSRETPLGSTIYGEDFRRQWSVETAVRSALARHAELELRWVYQGSFEQSAPPYATRRLGTIDRVLQLEARTTRGRWALRVGGLHDRILVDVMGDPLPGYRTRIESRGYVGLSARFGRVSLDAVEGIELDPEPYTVWLVHDKAFLHLQTTF